MISVEDGEYMGYNYGMHGKSSQQQAIVRQREREEKLRKQERERQNEITCKPIMGAGSYEAVTFSKGVNPILELRVSDIALANEPCGLDRDIIHQWLESNGMKFVKDVMSFEIVLIKASDVVVGKLVTEWKNLNRIKQ